jgi:Fe-S-cluster containining protein
MPHRTAESDEAAKRQRANISLTTESNPSLMMGGSEDAIWSKWFLAVSQPPVTQGLRNLYGDLDADVAARKPTCWLSGRCCKFESYGHKLYVTGLEIAWVIAQLDGAGRAQLHEAQLPGMDGCPFQVNGMCSVHALRPLGCRVYFCDANAQSWQNEVYEQFLGRLRLLHEDLNLPYRYMEWRQGLREARAALGCKQT